LWIEIVKLLEKIFTMNDDQDESSRSDDDRYISEEDETNDALEEGERSQVDASENPDLQ